MAFLSPSAAPRDEDYAQLLASPATLLPSPLAQGLFSQPSPGATKAFAVQEGRLSFDMLLQEHDSNESSADVEVLGLTESQRLNSARSASHLELFALAAPQAKPAEPARLPLAELQTTLTQAVAAKVAADKENEAAALVAGVAAKYGLTADYSQARDTIKAVWAEPRVQPSRAGSIDSGKQQQPASQQQHTAGGDEPTLAKKSSTDQMSCDEEVGPQATSSLKPTTQAVGSEGIAGLKRPLVEPVAFTFHVPAQPAGAAAASEDASLKRRRVQYDRMREMEAEVQRLRHAGDALKHSLRQAQVQHTTATQENEQLWNALLHIHASLRAAHAAFLKQQVAMHAAAVAAALPIPQARDAEPAPGLFGGLFSPDGDELAAACGMFISPAKPAAAAGAGAANNKPRKLFLEDDGGKGLSMGLGGAGRPSLLGAAPAAELSPALWVQTQVA